MSTYNPLNRKPKVLQTALQRVMFAGELPDVLLTVENFTDKMKLSSAGLHQQGDKLYICDVIMHECKSANGDDIQRRLEAAVKRAGVSVKASRRGDATILQVY